MGSAGLVSVWALLFPGAEPWGHRTALIIWGSLLGIFLTMWDVNGKMDGLIPFFVIWQGGMAAGLGLADEAGRARSSAVEPI